MSPRRQPPASADVESALGPLPESYTRPELVLLRFRRHGRRLAFPVILLVALAGASGYWVGALPAPWMNLLAGGGAAVLGLLLGVLPVLAWLAHRTTVTTRRVIVRHGFFVRHRSEIPLARVREVRLRRGLLQRLCGAGDIDVLFGAESLRLEDVPGSERVADALQELMERNYEHSTQSAHRVDPPIGGGSDSDRGASVGFW